MDANLFVGAWRLVSMEAKDANGNMTPLLGKIDHGILTYTADGYMCVALMNPDRPHSASSTFFDTTDGERAAMAQGYVSYAGRYEITDGKILHHVEISMFPNWVGDTQERGYTLDGNRLTLVAPGVTLVWERVTPR